MNHLTVEEIIAFVSATELNDSFLKLAGKVNGHIAQCDECLKKVKAFQTVYDVMTGYNDPSGCGKISQEDFKAFLSEYYLEKGDEIDDIKVYEKILSRKNPDIKC